MMSNETLSSLLEQKDLSYLSGFVWVFHSGGLLYVDFRCIHTSRLREEQGEKAAK